MTALARGGAAAIRVDPLARDLGVTRGSFYWHFEDRDALLMAVLDTWVAAQTDDVIAQVSAAGGPPDAVLRRLLEACADDDGQLERALRDWAATDGRVASAVAAADHRRRDYLATLLRAVGQPHDQAEARARIVYAAWLGEFVLASGLASTDERQAFARNLHTLAVQHALAEP